MYTCILFIILQILYANGEHLASYILLFRTWLMEINSLHTLYMYMVFSLAYLQKTIRFR